MTMFVGMSRKILFTFFILLQAFLIKAQGISLANDIISSAFPSRFIIPLASKNPDFPSFKLLQTALAGYKMLLKEHTLSRSEVITIIDFSLPSDRERLWVLDLVSGKVLFHCLVSHGRNSGEVIPESFSNEPGSFASSPGFYSTGETYIGKHGLSLSLDGLENGINDKARERAIVMHGADYVSADFIKHYGRLGRSLGCPAVPEELSKEIIETIKGGSCLFIYAPQTNYSVNSPIINKITTVTKG
jgi:hypothetical protein